VPFVFSPNAALIGLRSLGFAAEAGAAEVQTIEAGTILVGSDQD
jgi:hypothetical protein